MWEILKTLKAYHTCTEITHAAGNVFQTYHSRQKHSYRSHVLTPPSYSGKLIKIGGELLGSNEQGMGACRRELREKEATGRGIRRSGITYFPSTYATLLLRHKPCSFPRDGALVYRVWLGNASVLSGELLLSNGCNLEKPQSRSPSQQTTSKRCSSLQFLVWILTLLFRLVG